MVMQTFIGFCTLLPAISVLVDGKTHASDVFVLSAMYSSLRSPSQLSGWSSSGGDPCGDDWKGVKCSGSAVTEINLSGLGLSGSLGYQLTGLTSVTYFDVSKNNLKGDIPYQLPPNLVHLNMASNGYTGNVPYSISSMSELKYLNLAHNHLSGQLSEMFGGLSRLVLLDFSYNTLSGNLPQSFGSLKSIHTMHLQHNQFTGPITVLAKLPLQDLNVASNHFSGWIPNELRDIDNMETEGNSWSSAPAPPGSHEESKQPSSKNRVNKSTVTGGIIATVAISVLILAVMLLVLYARKSSVPHTSQFLDEEKVSQSRPFTPLVSQELEPDMLRNSSIGRRSSKISSLPSLKSSPFDRHVSFKDTDIGSKLKAMNMMEIVAATAYSLHDLQEATASFSASCLIGKGSIGCVYRAKFADGKVLAVKKIDSNNCEDFAVLISAISRLRHSNIVELLGYCTEKDYRLLVYGFMRNGSLHNFLHLSDDYSKPLTWNTRIRIALGTARALEYLHEGCSPPVVHRHIKSANILLDIELKPYLSDCGLSIFHEYANGDGEGGYFAPECIKPSAYTSKSDVYSFGVVMLELLTGQMPVDRMKEQSLVSWAKPQLHDFDALEKMADSALRGLYPPKSLSRFADIIAQCVQSEPDFRPTMSEVVQSLVRCERT